MKTKIQVIDHELFYYDSGHPIEDNQIIVGSEIISVASSPVEGLIITIESKKQKV